MRLNDVPDLLRRAAALLTDENWIQGNSSRDERGNEIYPDLPAACRWCTDGALVKIAGPDESVLHDEAQAAVLDVVEKMGFQSVEDWNDQPGRTAADVRKVLLKAADLYE